MKRLLTASLLLVFSWSTASAETGADASTDFGPQALEAENPSGGLPALPGLDEIMPDLGEEEIESAVSEEAATSTPTPAATVAIDSAALNLDEVVPALLTVERQKQHATACQYWLKMENRLPFKIRNLALRFSAYVKDENYDEPVLFDTEIRSFSELRPSDSQFRDIFYEYADCGKLAFIRVQDAGRCSAGTLNKFSSQSGDCIRFVEVKPSSIVCIYIDDGSGAANNAPCGEVVEADIDAFLSRFTAAYEAGDMDAFLALFDPNVETAGGLGSDLVKEKYAGVFSSDRERTLNISNRQWTSLGGGAAEVRFDAANTLHKTSGIFSMFSSSAAEIKAEMKVRLVGDGLVISRFMTSDPAGQ